MENGDTLLRIGELSRRSGVRPELLRAWERRYGLLRPIRSPGGLRLYSLADLERVRVMRQLLAGGLAAGEAAAAVSRSALGEGGVRPVLSPGSTQRQLADALAAFDEPRAQVVIDQLLAVATVDTVLTEVFLPLLRDLGERWARGEASIAQEHFASTVLRGRMLGLARGWGRGVGPLALLACLPGELHDLGLIAFGLALRSRGWRIAYLGTDTPLQTVQDAARSLAPALVVLTSVTDDRIRPVEAELRKLASEHRLALGGNAAADGGGTELGALILNDAPVTAAEQVTVLEERARRSRGDERHGGGETQATAAPDVTTPPSSG